MRVRTTDSIQVGFCILALLAAGGCTIHIGPQDGGDDTPTSIFITMVNDTGTALDPQIYVADASNGLDHLYDGSNQRTDFGLGGRGIIEPGKDATIATACDPPVFIATEGGLYGDDLDNPAGQGPPIMLEQDQSVRCGDHVTFTFSVVDGALQTSYTVEPL
jgi:hypothetical protein